VALPHATIEPGTNLPLPRHWLSIGESPANYWSGVALVQKSAWRVRGKRWSGLLEPPHQCPDSEVRTILRRPLLRTSESKDTATYWSGVALFRSSHDEFAASGEADFW